MTSLADQLRRYSKPQTSNLERVKVRASLLFDPKEAAGIQKEIFYEIGCAGLQELSSKDEVFDQFIETLFSLESKDFERSVESPSSNVKLDKQIKKFLLLLSPYVLLHCTWKALEWLIYRYSIHQYNRHDFLMLLLPYRDTKIFLKAISLMKFEEVNDPWAFLKDIQKAGVPLCSQVLFNHAASDPQMVHYVSDYILDIIEVHEKHVHFYVAFNLYAKVLMGAIEYSKGTSEAIITQMLPALLKGLSSHILDFRAASYIITGRMVTKCTLSDVLLDKFMHKISKIDDGHLEQEAVLLKCLIYQGQPHYKTLPDKSIAEIICHQHFPKTLQELNNDGTFIYPFLEPLIKKVIENGLENDAANYRTFLNNLLDELNIEDNVAGVMNVILDAIPRKVKNLEVETWITELIKKLETQYPTQFDQHVYNILTLPENQKRKYRLQKILRGVNKLQKKFDIFMKLYDSNTLIRIDAVKFILQHYDEFRDEEKDILKISLKQRLRDDSVDVVKEALGVIDRTKVLQGMELNKLLCELLLRCYKEKNCRGKVLKKVLKLLCIDENSYSFDIITIVFPILLPKTNEEIVFAKLLIQTPWFQNSPLFSKFDTNADLSIIGNFPNELFKCLKASENSKIIVDILSRIDNVVLKNLHPIQKYSAALLLSNSLGEKALLEDALPFLDVLVNICDNNNINDSKSTKTDCSILECIKLAKKNIFPLSGYLQCIFNMVMCVCKVNLEKLDFTSSDPSSRFLYKAASIFYHDSENIHQLFSHKFNNFVFETDNAIIEFMLHLALYKGCYGSIHQDGILNLLLKKIESCSMSLFFNLEKNYVPYLLILLTSLDEEVRKKAFLIGEVVQKFPADEKESYFPLVKYLMEHQEEIILDSKQLPIIVSNALSLQATDSLVCFCCNPDIPIYLRAGICKVLSGVNNMSILEKISSLAMSISTDQSGLFDEYKSQIIYSCIQRYDSIIGKDLKKECNAFKFLNSFLKIDKECLNIDGDLISPSLLIMNQLNKTFFPSLHREVEMKILDSIIEVSINPPNPNISFKSNKIFKHIDLDVDLIMPQLTDMENARSENTGNKKRKRSSIPQTPVPTIDILDTLEWKKGVRILELIQDKKKIINVKSLIPKLFNILKKCLNFEEQSAVEYPKQLILSLLLLSCQKLENTKLSENSFDMELVVQCIRASSNPQTHHHALQVLTHCAILFPTQVLHHIMAIFTFMGSSIQRYEDNYSFQLISNIIDSVIPILVKDGSSESIVSVLRVFVDALLDVPEHRRLKLYTQVLEKFDVENHLHLFLQLVFVSHVLYGSEESDARKKYKFEDHSTIRRLNIAIEMVMQFPPSVAFNACKKLIHNLKKLPVEKVDLQKNTLEFDISDLTDKQFRNFKYTMLIFINNLISSKEFISRIAILSDEDHESLEPYCKDIIVGILSYIQKTHPVLDKNQNSHYWKAIQNLSLEILDCMNALLTPEMFLLVIKGLMSHDLTSIRKRSLDLLNSKLEYDSFIEECSHKDLHSVVDSLIILIGKLNADTNKDEMIVIQKALLCLKLIVKTVGSEDPEKYIEILAFITKLLKSDKAEDHVLSSLILCLVELFVTLRARAIEYFPTFMPVLLKLLTRERKNDSPTLLCVSLLTAIQKIFEFVPQFISPYLKKVLYELSLLNGKWIESENDPKFCRVVQKLKTIKSKLAENIPMRILMFALEDCYSDIIEKNKLDSIPPLMDILAQNLRNLPDISPHLIPELKKFFMITLEFRNLELCDIQKIEIIEKHIIEALTTFVLKLSESAFKPFFNRIFIWAEESEEKNNRIITFYNVTCALGNQLKSLFALFANVFIKNAAKILDACNKQKSPSLYFDSLAKNTLLLEKVMLTLKLVFEHTNRKFITKERFEMLMQPIVDNLENDLNGMADLERRNNEILTPLVVHFVIATADDSLWKQLNYQVLLKMRSSNYKIRLIGLSCLTAIAKKLGEEFLALLPETIPFLSELLEDDHEIVQENCKKSIQELEEVLGENLMRYF